MAGELIWAFRVMRLPLRDAGGGQIGRVQDIVAVPGPPGDLPRVTGFVAESQRRRIFVNANRIADARRRTACACAAGTSTSTRSSRGPARCSSGAT